MNEFGSSDLIDHLCHCRLREPYLIGRFGVAKKLFRCRVAADGHDLFFAHPDVKNVCESKYSVMTAATLPGLLSAGLRLWRRKNEAIICHPCFSTSCCRYANKRP